MGLRLKKAELFILACFVQAGIALHPIVYVASNPENRLEAKLNITHDGLPGCPKIAESFTIWLNETALSREKINCWVQYLRLTYNEKTGRTHSMEGVEISVPGFGSTESIENLSTNSTFNKGNHNYKFINYLANNGYERDVSLRGAPYDWRRGYNEQQEYFEKLTNLIEKTYETNSNKKVLLVAHSLGGILSQHFLMTKTADWKSNYIKAFVAVATPFGGSVEIFEAFLKGDNMGVRLLTPHVVARFEKSEPPLFSLLPSPNVWGEDEVIIQSKHKNYTSGDYEMLFKDMDFKNGFKMWKDNAVPFANPGVPVHCLYGTGIPTNNKWIVDDVANPTEFRATKGDGDFRINRRGLEACKLLAANNSHEVFWKAHKGSNHFNILVNKKVLKYIIALGNKDAE